MGIFDLDHTSWAFRTREFLERAERENRVIPVVSYGELPRSFILTAGTDGVSHIYLSQLSPSVLIGRLTNPLGYLEENYVGRIV